MSKTVYPNCPCCVGDEESSSGSGSISESVSSSQQSSSGQSSSQQSSSQQSSSGASSSGASSSGASSSGASSSGASSSGQSSSSGSSSSTIDSCLEAPASLCISISGGCLDGYSACVAINDEEFVSTTVTACGLDVEVVAVYICDSILGLCVSMTIRNGDPESENYLVGCIDIGVCIPFPVSSPVNYSEVVDYIESGPNSEACQCDCPGSATVTITE